MNQGVDRPVFIRGQYFGPKTIFIPPLSENDIFPSLAACRFSTLILPVLPKYFPVLDLFYPFTFQFLPFSFLFLLFFL